MEHRRAAPDDLSALTDARTVFQFEWCGRWEDLATAAPLNFCEDVADFDN